MYYYILLFSEEKPTEDWVAKRIDPFFAQNAYALPEDQQPEFMFDWPTDPDEPYKASRIREKNILPSCYGFIGFDGVIHAREYYIGVEMPHGYGTVHVDLSDSFPKLYVQEICKALRKDAWMVGIWLHM